MKHAFDNPRWWLSLLILLLLYAAWGHWQNRPVKRPVGIMAPTAPHQSPPSGPARYQVGKYELLALADFSLEARVLRKERYRFDRESTLSPLDLALGWGGMSDTAVIDQLDMTQGNRFYYYRWKNPPPLPPAEMASSSANMHLIPTSSAIKKRMMAVRPGQIVYIRGQLIEAKSPEGFRWTSSLTRDDSGAGACEIIRVEEFQIRR